MSTTEKCLITVTCVFHHSSVSSLLFYLALQNAPALSYAFFSTIFLDKGHILLEVYIFWYFMPGVSYQPHLNIYHRKWLSRMHASQHWVKFYNGATWGHCFINYGVHRSTDCAASNCLKHREEIAVWCLLWKGFMFMHYKYAWKLNKLAARRVLENPWKCSFLPLKRNTGHAQSWTPID